MVIALYTLFYLRVVLTHKLQLRELGRLVADAVPGDKFTFLCVSFRPLPIGIRINSSFWCPT